ncbi:preprotein translocase subunit SecY [Parvularcula flava]|uniref:Protein translocase subunit SecY n=1 Tax=Aquisalinus luteolus TaxID=1566827 RepID=A0A8J3A5K3_9PROT|nr:preprotein translocase subunit SecY [Aquisalinus luteolus]NHK27343.1 preprotein translocase subunit SecY [Aquisalinus luteolus]GGH95147.1 protein translocase subunit SecY [Aquisalinus luteolus]
MSSAAEQFTSNFDIRNFAKADELKKRLLFTLGALIVYRLGTYIPIPGVNPEVFGAAFQSQQQGILGQINLFAGGAIERMAIFALNIMPYISASIIMQMMTAMVPSLEAIKKEGEQGRRQINHYTRMLTVALAIVQGLFIAQTLMTTNSNGLPAVSNPGIFFMATTTITLVGGVMFLLWLGEQITARGVGNGISLIIFAGIIAELPRAAAFLLEQAKSGQINAGVIIAIIIGAIAIIAFVVFMERSQRRLLVQYPRRQQGNRMTQGEKSHLPLKLNTSGVIPPIFASSLMFLPATAVGALGEGAPLWLQNLAGLFTPGQPLYMGLYAVGIIFFCFLYTSIVFNPSDTADNLKKYGGYIQGYRPGPRTAEYIDFVLTRLTVIGAAYLTAVCLLPEILRSQSNGSIPVYLGGTSLLIAVTVTLDTVQQIQGYLLAQQYESLIKKSRLRGAKR